jgi:hypothetical protein
LFAWNVSKNGFHKIKTAALSAALLRGVTGDMALCSTVILEDSEHSRKNLSIIDDQDFCAKVMTAQYVFLQRKLALAENENLNDLTGEELKTRKKEFIEEFTNLDENTIELWKCEARRMVGR